MASYTVKLGYFALLFGLCYILYYLLNDPGVVRSKIPAVDWSSMLSSLSTPVPGQTQHHPLAEHANTLTERLFNSFTMPHRLVSPLGIAFSLAVVQEAAVNQTAVELAQVLGGQYTYDDLRKIQSLFREQNDSVVDIVSYWSVNHNISIHPAFIEENEGICTISSDNFEDNLRVSHKINQFFAERTSNHINSIAKAIRPSTSSVLLNTLYFQANWKEAFDPVLTHQANFTQFLGTNRITGMMRKRAYFNYFQSPTEQLVEIPYNNTAYVMGILLPSHVHSENRTKMVFNFTTLMQNIEQMKSTNVEVVLPKFKHKKMVRTHVNLRALGVKSVFDPKKAALPRLGSKVILTEMIHDVIFMADELGSNSNRAVLNRFIAQSTKAKSSTALSLMHGSPGQKVMRCDHSFIYYVRHLPTNTIILIGDLDSP